MAKKITKKTAKTVEKKTLEELMEKSEKTQKDQKLVEIVIKAPVNEDGRINLNWIYVRAFACAYASKNDFDQAEKLAIATRFLGMFRRDYPEVFNDTFQAEIKELGLKERTADSTAESRMLLVNWKGRKDDNENKETVLPAEKCVHAIGELEAQKPEPKPESKKKFEEVEFNLGYGSAIEIITREFMADTYIGGVHWEIPQKKRTFRFIYEPHALGLVLAILNKFFETVPDFERRYGYFAKELVKILEKGYRVQIRSCNNCENRKHPLPTCSTSCGDSFSYWVPEETPLEKKEEEKTCGNCGKRMNCKKFSVPNCPKWVADDISSQEKK